MITDDIYDTENAESHVIPPSEELYLFVHTICFACFFGLKFFGKTIYVVCNAIAGELEI